MSTAPSTQPRVGAARHVQPYVVSLINAACDSPIASSRRSRSVSPRDRSLVEDVSRFSADQPTRVRHLHSMAVSSPASTKARARATRVKSNTSATLLSLSRLDASPIPHAQPDAPHAASDASFSVMPQSRAGTPPQCTSLAPLQCASPDLSGVIPSQPRSVVSARVTSSDLYASGPAHTRAAVAVAGSDDDDDEEAVRGPWSRSPTGKAAVSRRLSFGAVEPPPAAATAVCDDASGAQDTPTRATPRRSGVVWRRVALPDGRVYYYHVATRVTAWTLPPGARLAGVPTPLTAQRAQQQRQQAKATGAPAALLPVTPLPARTADVSSDVTHSEAVQSDVTVGEDVPQMEHPSEVVASRLRILKSRMSRTARSSLSVTSASDTAPTSPVVTVMDIAQRAPVACTSCGQRLLGAEALCTHLVNCTAWHATMNADVAGGTALNAGLGSDAAVHDAPCPYCSVRMRCEDLWRHMLTECHAPPSIGDVSQGSAEVSLSPVAADDVKLLTTAPVDASTRMVAAAARALFNKSR